MKVDVQDNNEAPLLIHNGIAVLPDRTAELAVAVVNGRIEALLEDSAQIESWVRQHPASQVVNAEKRWVLPGLIDIHCDAIEKEVQPRPGTLFPLEMALLEFERKLPVHGITTMYHSLSLGVGLSLRGDHLLTGMVDCIHDYNRKRAMIRNRIHLRFEVSHLAGLPIVEQYLREKAIDYLSFMDHSPGRGQYRAEGSFENYVMKNQGVNREEVAIIVANLMERRREMDPETLHRLGVLAAENGIAMASHDDDAVSLIDEGKRIGVSVSEFPLNLATALYAEEQGLQVCLGAPNVVRGGSHDNNLRATDAIAEGVDAILCSDYHPSSLLAAVFKLYDEGIAALPRAVRMASLNAARALGADDELGSIELGKAADLIIVDRYEGLPWVTNVMVAGKPVYTASVRY